MALKIRILAAALCSLPLFAQAQIANEQASTANTATEIQNKASASGQAEPAQTVVSNSEQNQTSSDESEKAALARKEIFREIFREKFREQFREQWRQIESSSKSSSNSDSSVSSASETCVYSRSSFTYSCN